jgi:PhnB protein
MQIHPYLFFDRQCAAAFQFYARCLDGKIAAMVKYGDTPAGERFPEWKDQILHAHLTVGEFAVLGSDAAPGLYKTVPDGFKVSIQVKDPKEAERIFQALAENGTIEMPMEKTFWSERFGMLVDQFGIPWMINCLAA